MQPAHPEDSSYARRRGARCAPRDFAVAAHVDGPLIDAALAGADVLVIAHPSDPRWERTDRRRLAALQRRRARRDRGVRAAPAAA